MNPTEGIALFTDGSCWSRDGSGGWAWLALDAFEGELHDAGGASDTTNNRMEIQAWIEGLNAMHQSFGPCQILVYSDSEYVGLGVTHRDRKRNANKDLWKALDQAVDQHEFVEFHHIKGHTGHQYNERVDKLASKARSKYRDAQ